MLSWCFGKTASGRGREGEVVEEEIEKIWENFWGIWNEGESNKKIVGGWAAENHWIEKNWYWAELKEEVSAYN